MKTADRVCYDIFFLLLDMTGSQLKIATTIDQFYDEGAPMGIYGIKYKEAVAKLEQQAQDEVVNHALWEEKKIAGKIARTSTRVPRDIDTNSRLSIIGRGIQDNCSRTGWTLLGLLSRGQ